MVARNRPIRVLVAALCLSGLFVLAAAPAHAQIYVDNDASGAGDGSSWTDAYTDLQTAIDNASSSSELWVAEGIYKPDSEGDSFTITGTIDGVEVYGGFEGTESSRSERAPREHRTILSGDLNGDDTDPDGDGIIEDAADLEGGENAHHVLVLDGGNGIGSDVSANVTSSTVIDGLVVTAGQADGSGPDENGGGLYCDGESTDNECSPTLRNVVFAGNAASNFGGAIYNNGDSGTSSPQVTAATFAGNAASDGGAIYNNSNTDGTASPSVTNATFIGNAVDDGGGAIYNDGRENGTSSPQITNATFTNNAAATNGGAIHNNVGVDPLQQGTVSPQIANTILWDNTADSNGDGIGSGDEIYNAGSDATPTLTHTIIEGGLSGISENDGSSTTDAGGNLDQDPQFTDASSLAGPDGIVHTFDDGLNVHASSPALDAGDNAAVPADVSTDITGGTRMQDRDGDGTATVNIGAYEVAFVKAPTAQTGSASNVGGTTAQLSGTVNPRNGETSVQAQVYPTSDPTAVRTITDEDGPFTGGTSQSVTVSLGGLSPNTEYEARITATNSKGGDRGRYVDFTTTSDGYTRTITGTDGTQNDAGWRMLALPAAGKTRAALEGDVDFSIRSTDILYRWDGAGQSWNAQTASSDNLPRGEGFMLYLYDDSGEEIDSEGLPVAVSTGSEDQTADKTVSGLGQSEIFHLLANPYDQAFDLGSLAGGDLPGAGFQATVQVWDPAQGSYTQITQGDSGDELPAWQGVFVERSSSGSGQTSLTFAASGKQSSDGNLIGSKSTRLLAGKAGAEDGNGSGGAKGTGEHAEIPLTLTLEGGEIGSPPSPSSGKTASKARATETRTDRAVYWVDSRATSGYDAYEAKDLAPPSDNHVRLAFPFDRSGTLVQRAQAAAPYPSSAIDRTVPLSVNGVSASGSATIALPDAATSALPDDWSVRLTDTETGTTTDLRTAEYTFDLAEGTAIASPSDARFRLEVQNSTIPVELASFEGQASEEGVRLSWRTASEQNNAGFRVERKSARERGGERAWTDVGFVEGSGTTSEVQRYRFTDTDLPYAADSLRYRLTQVDADGTTSLTDPVTVARGGPEGLQLLGTAPNPARSRATIRYAIPEGTDGDLTIRLYDVMGRRVRTVEATTEPGRHEQVLDVSGLSSGVYVLRLRVGGQAKTRKLTVVR